MRSESVSELMIVKKNNNKKLYTVLSCVGVFTFCTCCKILICFVCFVASFNNNNNNNIYLLQLGCHPVAVVILHVNKHEIGYY